MNVAKEKATLAWRQTAAHKAWSCVKAGLEVYRHSGEKLTADPRVTEEYKTEVVKGLRLDPVGPEYDHLAKEDIAAIVENGAPEGCGFLGDRHAKDHGVALRPRYDPYGAAL